MNRILIRCVERIWANPYYVLMTYAIFDGPIIVLCLSVGAAVVGESRSCMIIKIIRRGILKSIVEDNMLSQTKDTKLVSKMPLSLASIYSSLLLNNRKRNEQYK